MDLGQALTLVLAPAGRGAFLPRKGEPGVALTGGGLGNQRWLVHCTPHFLFSFPE